MKPFYDFFYSLLSLIVNDLRLRYDFFRYPATFSQNFINNAFTSISPLYVRLDLTNLLMVNLLCIGTISLI